MCKLASSVNKRRRNFEMQLYLHYQHHYVAYNILAIKSTQYVAILSMYGVVTLGVCRIGEATCDLDKGWDLTTAGEMNLMLGKSILPEPASPDLNELALVGALGVE